MSGTITAAATSVPIIVALLVLALNWFNPVAWVAFRAFRADQELACDAAVAAPRRPKPRRLCPRAGQVGEPARPDRRLPAQPCRSTETETEDAEATTARTACARSPARAHRRSCSPAALTAGSPGLAHPHPEGENKSERQRARHHHGASRRRAAAGMRRQRCPDPPRRHGEAVDPRRATAARRRRAGQCRRGQRRQSRAARCCAPPARPPPTAPASLQRARERIAETTTCWPTSSSARRDRPPRSIARAQLLP